MTELLFNKDTFEEEFRKLLGFVDADIAFDSIHSELLTATREMTQTIGKTTYATFVVIAKKDDFDRNPEEKEILQLARYPIAMNAYRMAAPSKDLQHTNQGRLMRTDDQQARPFQWMIDRNNEANDRKYHRGMDDLLEYLFDQASFQATDEYKVIKSFFVSSTRDFEEYFPIHSRFLLLKLQPGLRQAQRDQIKAIVGKEKYDELLTAHKSPTGIPEEDEALFELIKEACVYWSLSWAMSRLTITLLPEGILQRYTGDRNSTKASKTPEMLQARLADEKFKEDAKRVFAKIEAIVTASEPQEEPDEDDDNPFSFDQDDYFATT